MTRVRLFTDVALCGALALLFSLPAAHADDFARGQQLVQTHCVACHGTPARSQGEVADAPPLNAVARKYGHDASALSAAILGPHPKMNFMPAPDDARAIAAYLSGLPR